MSRMIRLICTLTLLAAACAAQTSGKKRVAVLDFDYGTVQSYVSSIYGSNQDVGKGITDMLVEKLVKDGKYSVIERKALDKILAAVAGLARSLLEKFCSARILSRALRSITEYLPSFTSFSTSMSVMPLPTSWLPP